jgi:hypothetical protein
MEYGLIRKIVIGRDPKDAMAYYVGMRAGKGHVSAIAPDDRYQHKYGQMRYLIYIETDNGTMLWKAVDGMPCIIEYDLNF